MGDLAIRVENIGKRYFLRQGARAGYKTFREAIEWRFRKLAHLFAGRGQALRKYTHGDEFWALRDISFDVAPGEVLGVIGRNGSGKSTLLKILSRITEPTTGQAEIYGRVGSLLEVGTGFHHELTGRENIYMNGAIIGMHKAEIDRKFDEIVAFSEIEQFLDTPVKRYSSGMYMRLAFSVAAHLEPDILIIDEVLAVGDATFQKKCLGKMEEVSKDGRTILFVSHNMGAIRSLCSRTLLLAHGQLVQMGPTDEVVSHYIQSLDQQSSDYLPLAARFDASSRAAIVGFGITDAAGHAQMEVLASTGMHLVYQIHCQEPDLAGVSVQFTICDQNNYPIAHCNNIMNGDTITLHEGLNIVTCQVSSLPFRTGLYLLNIALYLQQQELSHIHNAISFGIVNDLVNQSYAFPDNAPVVTLHQQWRRDDLERLCE